MKETDLYTPVKQMLEAQGFYVKGEVKGCDVAATKGDALWVVEMKLHFNMKLLYQAMARLAVTPHVFVALPRPRRINKDFRKMQQILEKLEIGLILVGEFAETVLYPADKKPRNNAKTRAIRKEMEARTGDSPGGSSGVKINTAFRETNIKIACLLEQHGALTPKALRGFGCAKGTQALLYRNFYGWFMRRARGLYGLSPQGTAYLVEKAATGLVSYYRQMALESVVK